MLEGAAKWLVRFFEEEAEGNLRMEDQVYTQLRQDVLDHAWKVEPAVGSALAPAVWAALVVSMSRFQESPSASLPSMRGRKVRFDYPEKWVASQPLAEWLNRNRETANRLAQYASTTSSNLPTEAQSWPWFGTWERLQAPLRELTLRTTLPAPRASGPRPRF